MNDLSETPVSAEATGDGAPEAETTDAAGPAAALPQSGVSAPPEPRRLSIRGIHHVTVICSDLAQTVAFYRDLLGMTLLKESVNPDDPQARHFYFGDPHATPGTMLTFMEYPNMEAGQIGTGVTHHIALRVGSLEELEAWHVHLSGHGVQCTEPLDRTYFSSIYFRDPDGHIVEIATDGPGLVID